MPSAELIYDIDCPNVAKTRMCLLQAFVEVGLHPKWSEWNRGDPTSPQHVRGYGSPTILIDGEDIAGTKPIGEASCCRVYEETSGKISGVPPIAMISSMLQKSLSDAEHRHHRKPKTAWRSLFATLPGIGATLLPVGICPACWPAYAGLLGSLGLGFLLDTTYMLPITILIMLVAMGALGYRAKARRGYRPLILGVLGSCIAIFGKFGLANDLSIATGIAILVLASVWNVWALRENTQSSCPACPKKNTKTKT